MVVIQAQEGFAFDAGVRAGDRILAVGEKRVGDLSTDKARPGGGSRKLGLGFVSSCAPLALLYFLRALLRFRAGEGLAPR